MKQHAIFFNTALTILLASSTLSNPVTSLQEKGGKAKSKPRYNFEVTQGGSDSLICDVAITDTIDDPLDSDLFSFSVSEGEILSITVVEDSSAGANFQAFWRLLDSAGNPAPDCGSFTTASQMDCGPLPTVGNPYRIEVTDFLNDDTGTYHVYLQRLTSTFACEDIPLTCDSSITDTLDNPLDTDLFSFSVDEGEIVSIIVVEGSSAGTNFQAFWRLLDSAGNPAPDCGSFTTASQMDCGPLPTVGNPYRIEVTDFLNDDTGNYSMRIIFLTSGCPPTSVTENTDNVPSSFELRQNYPNPFNPSTTIEFSLPRFDFVTLKVFNLLGEEIATLVDEELSVGPYKVEWDASGVASGIYIYRLQTLGFFESKKLILVK